MGYILKGIGDSVTGKNEIVPTFDAKIYNFYSQVDPGIVASEANRFPISIIDRGIIVGPGLAHAYGYFGMSDAPVQFNFVIPSSGTQYSKVYVEFDLSARPQAMAVKVTPQSDTSVIELQQDKLSEITTGVYQIQLYLIAIQTNGTITFTDQRNMLNRVAYSTHSINSDLATNSKNLISGGTIASNVTAHTQAQTDNSTKVATTSYVRTAITNVKNITTGTLSVVVSNTSVPENWVKRQVNFVIGCIRIKDSNATRYETTSKHLATIPEGFRPKTQQTIVIEESMWTYSGSYRPNIGKIDTDGKIYVTADGYGGGSMAAIRAYGWDLWFAYEIT